MLRKALKRSKLLVVLWSIFSDSLARAKQTFGVHSSHSGDTHLHMNLQESLGYINAVYDDYLRIGGLSENDLKGKRILEIGPGDNFGVALKFLAAGAESVACLDRFYSNRNTEQQRGIYHELFKSFSPQIQASFPEFLQTFADPRLKPLYGTGLEEADRLLGDSQFDLIVSRSVLEHVSDIEKAFFAMNNILHTGGLMIHKIDFRDHGMFTEGGHNPLTFLTIPEWLYRTMSTFSGRPNRKLINTYRNLAARLQLQAKFSTTQVVTDNDLKEIRPKLDAAYRDLPDEDLLIAGIFLLLKKKAVGN